MRVSFKLFWVIFFVFTMAVQAASSSLEVMKMNKRFGVGISAGGPLAVLGVETDVNVTENFSVGLGVGTGLNYSSFMMKGRYFLLGEWVSPYIGLSFARWWTQGTNASTIGPSVLSGWLGPGYDYTKGFSVFLLAPALGVQFMHPMGFAVSAELQYLFRLMDFANAAYAGLGFHWYF